MYSNTLDHIRSGSRRDVIASVAIIVLLALAGAGIAAPPPAQTAQLRHEVPIAAAAGVEPLAVCMAQFVSDC